MVGSWDNRAPRPLDDGSGGGGSSVGAKPLSAANGSNATASNLPAAAQSSAANDPPGRVTEVGDLPTAL